MRWSQESKGCLTIYLLVYVIRILVREQIDLILSIIIFLTFILKVREVEDLSNLAIRHST